MPLARLFVHPGRVIFWKVRRSVSKKEMDPGTRDRLVMCGQSACDVLLLDDESNSPNEVKETIERLQTIQSQVECFIRDIHGDSDIDWATLPELLDAIALQFDGGREALAIIRSCFQVWEVPKGSGNILISADPNLSDDVRDSVIEICQSDAPAAPGATP